MIKISSIVWYKVLPALFGGQKGIANFQEALSAHFPLSCICSRNNEPQSDTSFKVIPVLPLSKLQFTDPRCRRLITHVIKTEGSTHIILEHPYHGLAALRASRKSKARLILHSHNIESERFRLLGKSGWRLLQRYECWIHQKADCCLFKTTADRDWAIRHFQIPPGKCLIVPYGIQKPEPIPDAKKRIRERHHIHSTDKILLFAGSLDYLPNTVAVKQLFKEVIPRLDKAGITYKLIICGRDPKGILSNLNTAKHPSVLLAGEVESINEYFFAADVFINPVEIVAGVQTKNLEALAHDCTVVCFDKASAGIRRETTGSKLIIAKDNNWDNFTAMIEQALLTRERITESFFLVHSWETAIQPLVKWIKETSEL